MRGAPASHMSISRRKKEKKRKEKVSQVLKHEDLYFQTYEQQPYIYICIYIYIYIHIYIYIYIRVLVII